MAWLTPKTNWAAADVPTKDDFNRIEGNSLDNYTNKLNKTGDSKDNTVTFTVATTDAEIISGEKHSTIFGKILKRFRMLAAPPVAITASGTAAANQFKFITSFDITKYKQIEVEASRDSASIQLFKYGSYYRARGIQIMPGADPDTTLLLSSNIVNETQVTIPTAGRARYKLSISGNTCDVFLDNAQSAESQSYTAYIF